MTVIFDSDVVPSEAAELFNKVQANEFQTAASPTETDVHTFLQPIDILKACGLK